MYYFKESIFIFFYEFMMSTIAFAIFTIETTWVKVSLSLLCIVFFLFIVFIYFGQEGQKALKKLHENDLKRKRIVETSEYIEIEQQKEYKVWKGFVIGLLVFIPMFIFLFIYAIILICGGTSTLISGISSIIYMLFSAPIMAFVSTFQGTICFSVLYGAILTSIASGVGYILGAKKIKLQYEKIAEKQRYLHGE